MPAFRLQSDFNGIDPRFPSPDLTIAAGPSLLVLADNSGVAIVNKAGVGLDSKPMSEFFASVRARGANRLTDPWVVYDAQSGRFFLANSDRVDNAGCTVGTCIAHLLLAVSKSANPRSLTPADWYLYALDRTLDRTLDGTTLTTNWGDFDHIAVVGDVVAISMNMYTFAGSNQGVKVRLLDKSALVNGAPVTSWTDFVALPGGFRVATMFGNPGVIFLLRSPSCSAEILSIPLTPVSRVVTSRTVSVAGSCVSPPDVVQPGGGRPIDVVLGAQAVYRNGSLWQAGLVRSNFGSTDVSAIRWIQVDVSRWPDGVQILQNGIHGTDGSWAFAPTLMVDSTNGMGMVYGRAGATEFLSAYYVGRLASDPPNTLRAPNLLKSGAAVFSFILDGRNRYTDYFGISLDPADDSIWMLGMYAN